MSVLWVIGDSTLSAFDDNYYYPRYGYGTMLECYLDQSIEVKNIALSGRSSKSYTMEPEYHTLLEGMKKGDFLIIGFGHNDEKTEEGRYTNANGDFKTEGSFAHSLYENYIRPAGQAGCVPILCTPIVRRTESREWADENLHKTEDVEGFPGGDYRQAIIDLGKEMHIAVVDMTEYTRRLYDDMTPRNTLYLHAWTSNREIGVDNTHTNMWGARVNAWTVLKKIKEMGIKGLSEYIINTDDNLLNDREKYLFANSSYVPVTFSDDLRQSSLFEDYKEYKGTVFGDVSDDISKENFTLETDQDGNMHIAVRNNKGKIAMSSDGIAMYYKKVPANEKFTLTATVKVNDFFLNDQVAFGLMVRDDCYIDEYITDVLGDYVAAAPLHLTMTGDAVSTFARKNGKLVYGGKVHSVIKPGGVYRVRLSATGDGYMAQFGDGPEVTGGFDFKLTAIDPKHVYVGMFVTRNADVTFSDIQYVTQ